MSRLRIYTIGVYGFTEREFVEALRHVGITLFCDIRARRGVRGAQYAFANSSRLQELLHKENIKYIHIKGLAPSSKVRELQRESDKLAKTSKKGRAAVSNAFRDEYQRECLDRFDFTQFIELYSDNTVAFFCVEAEPLACHRSLVAEALSKRSKVETVHIAKGV